jgi:thiamine pyrophosphokinase
MKKCVIIGGSEIRNYEWVKSHINEGDFCIYCDSGLYHLESLGAEPGLILGDFDSHPEPDMDVETIKLPTEKDDTDTVYAVKEAIKRGYTDFVLVGVIGKRFDHTLGNLSILLMLHEKNLSAVIVDDYSEIRVISKENGVVTVDDDCKYFSILCAGGCAKEIKIEDAKYNLENADLTMEFPLGVSNEVLPGKMAKISVNEGRLFLIKIVDKNA